MIIGGESIMTHLKGISETEMEIMKFLWQQDKPISTVALLSYFNAEKKKGWKLQTISTFLSRLDKKGLLSSKNEGRGTVHYPAISYEEYNSKRAKNVLDVLYDGSIKNFFAALYGDKKLSREEIDELKQWLSER